MAYPLYLLAVYLLLPVVFARLWVKSRGNPAYRRRWPERLGFYSAASLSRPIWIHTVSVGEFNAAKPLIRELQQRYPDTPLLITATTTTGSAAVQAYPSNLNHVYLPYDLPGAVNRFLRHWQPQLCIIFETEIWPVLFKKTSAANIPIIMANARLSEQSARGYRYLKPLIASTLGQASVIATASQNDATRLQQLGATTDQLLVMGNIKFDYEVPNGTQSAATQLRQQILGERPVWIAASTHPDEEEQILAAHGELLNQNPNTLLILVPRHPERFEAVAELCERTFPTTRRSLGDPCESETAVYLADTMGELPLLYACADAVFVGGSLVPVGGHNLIEPAATGRAPVFGPHMHNFKEISELLLAANAAFQIADSQELARSISELLNDPQLSKDLGQRALDQVIQHRGACQLLLGLIVRELNQANNE